MKGIVMVSGSMGWTREHKVVEFAAKIRILIVTAASASRSNFSGVHRWLELYGARRHFVPSRTRSKAPNLRGEQSRVMCMHQEFAQKHKSHLGNQCLATAPVREHIRADKLVLHTMDICTFNSTVLLTRMHRHLPGAQHEAFFSELVGSAYP